MNPQNIRREQQKFGLLMATALGLIGALSMWREGLLYPYLLGAAALFAVAALVLPRQLAPVRRAWVVFGHVVGRINASIILTVFFATVITPVGFVLRLVRGRSDVFAVRRGATSYWIRRPESDLGAGMTQQF